MAGRRPNSSKTQAARGNAGKRAMVGTPEAPGGVIIPLPEVLAHVLAKQEWDRIIGDLTRMGIAKPVYSTFLSLYCRVVGEIRTQLVKLDHEEMIISGKQGPKVNPKFEIIYKMLTKLLPLATECGLTPASTRRLRAPDAPEDEERAQEREFFGGEED
jgi:P27 family predicted phage terminase small subunit